MTDAVRLGDLVGLGDGTIGVVIGRTAFGWIVEMADYTWLIAPTIYRAIAA